MYGQGSVVGHRLVARKDPSGEKAAAIGVGRKTICNWLCVPEFVAEIDRLSCMIDVASRAERLRMAMRVVRQKVRADGTVETERDVLDWLKFAQSETTGIKLGFSKGEVDEMDATINRAWQESVEAEVNRRLAEREATIDVRRANMNQRQIRADSDLDRLLLSDVNG